MKVPVAVAEKVLVTGSTVLSLVKSPLSVTVFSFPFVNVNVGELGSLIFIIPVPKDSIEFNIPSLSLSKSKLSTIPSSSKSVGHILIGISLDLYVAPVHVIVPLTA